MFILAVVVLFCIWFSYSKKKTALEQEIKVVNNLVMAEAIILAAKEANKTPEEKKEDKMAAAIKKKEAIYWFEYAKKAEATLLAQEAVKATNSDRCLKHKMSKKVCPCPGWWCGSRKVKA